MRIRLMPVPSRASAGQLESRVAALAARYGLDPETETRLSCLIAALLLPEAPTAITSPAAALKDHIADALVALELGVLQSASSVLDLGSGAGLPGIPLAAARPGSSFTLLEAAARKVRFLLRAVASCRLENVEVVHSRAESFAAAGRRYDVVTARAVGPLPVVLEYAAPLLRMGGTLIVWRGRRDPEAEASALVAAEQLGLGPGSIELVKPYDGAERRHLYVVSKLGETPSRFPRRAGMARKRPLGLAATSAGAPSDRIQR